MAHPYDLNCRWCGFGPLSVAHAGHVTSIHHVCPNKPPLTPEEGAAAAAGLLLMALEIAAADRTPWHCADCGRSDLTYQRTCPCHAEKPMDRHDGDDGRGWDREIA